MDVAKMVLQQQQEEIMLVAHKVNVLFLAMGVVPIKSHLL